MRLRFFNAAMTAAVASVITSDYQSTVNAVQLNSFHDQQHENIGRVLGLAQMVHDGATKTEKNESPTTETQDDSPKTKKAEKKASEEKTAEPKTEKKDSKKQKNSLVVQPLPKNKHRPKANDSNEKTKPILNIEGVKKLIE